MERMTPTTPRMRPTIALLLAAAWLAACAGEPHSAVEERRTGASRRAVAPPSGAARLVADGAQAFDGTSRAICAPHARSGLQVALRTGEPGLPAVALRIDRWHGEGAYRGRLFLTARDPAGALVQSSGEVRLRLARRQLPAGPAPAASAHGTEAVEPGRALVSGTFEGTYAGDAGHGAVRGRLGPCLVEPPPSAALP